MSRILATRAKECFPVPSFTVLSIGLISRKDRKVCYRHFLTVPDHTNLAMNSPDTQRYKKKGKISLLYSGFLGIWWFSTGIITHAYLADTFKTKSWSSSLFKWHNSIKTYWRSMMLKGHKNSPQPNYTPILALTGVFASCGRSSSNINHALHPWLCNLDRQGWHAYLDFYY